LLLPAFIVAGVLLSFAWTVRSVAKWFEPSFVPWPELMTFDAVLGWKPRPNLDVRYFADRDDIFRVVTDDEGWPGTHSVEASPVVVIGDSFAFGYGVNTGESFADLNPDVMIKAVGSPGYSMVQGMLLMEQFGRRLSGKLVVWFVCFENDLQDNLLPNMRRYRAPFVRRSRPDAQWEIGHDHLSAAPWESSDTRTIHRTLPHLCVPGPLTDWTFSAAEYLIARAARLCRTVDARLALVTIPVPDQLTPDGHAALARANGRADTDARLPDRRIADICQRHGVQAVAGMDHLSLRDYKRLEGIHWSARGHRRMADLLARLYGSLPRDVGNEATSRFEPGVKQQFTSRERAGVQA
jgi:hypothetical protein